MDVLSKFNEVNREELSRKDKIIERLLKNQQINVEEATILLKTINLSIEKADMSSGAKIVGGSDFQSTSY